MRDSQQTHSQTKAPAISIGLPVFNGENFLREAITSVLGQTFEDFELIIRDNASTDATETICREFAARDRRIRYIRNEANVGAGPNFNGIVAYARGRYFKWQAHDDVMAPTFLERCFEILESDPGAVLATPRVRFIDARGIALEDFATPARTDDQNPVIRYGEMLKGHRCFEVFGLIRLAELQMTRLIGAYAHGDGVLLAHLALIGRFAEIPEYLYYSRRHEGQSMYVFGVTNPKVKRDFEAYAYWFNPQNRLGVSRSYNKILAEYFRMIWVTPLSLTQRLACCGILFRWLLLFWRIMAGEWKRTLYSACGISCPQRQPKQSTG
jgi:glycosyltransferase involved in cell wall biosynthesis